MKDQIEANLQIRNGKNRELTQVDFSQRNVLFLRPEAQFDYLINHKCYDSPAEVIARAMLSIEADYSYLKGILPTSEYRALTHEDLRRLLWILDREELKYTSGNIFGRIYEYFLAEFANLKAHDNGEFLTPVSLASLITNVLEPVQGGCFRPGLRFRWDVRPKRPFCGATTSGFHRKDYLSGIRKESHHYIVMPYQ